MFIRDCASNKPLGSRVGTIPGPYGHHAVTLNPFACIFQPYNFLQNSYLKCALPNTAKSSMMGAMKPDSSFMLFINTFLTDRRIPPEGAEIHSLVGDGSTRTFHRITPMKQDCPSFVVVANTPTHIWLKRENIAYLMIGNHLFNKGLPIPRIYRFDLSNGWFIIEDAGTRHFQEEATGRVDRVPLYERVLEILFRLQIEGAQGFNTEWCWQTERYDETVMHRYESDYFRSAFLCNYLGMNQDWSYLEEAFGHLASMASMADNHHFLHRDFQSRNIMVSEHKISIIDWQGSRLGPLAYDVASILIDPYVDLRERERDQIFQHYLLLIKDHQPTWLKRFEKYYPYLAIQRNLQILGAFAYLSKARQKTSFEVYIPSALKTLRYLLEVCNDKRLNTLKELAGSLPEIHSGVFTKVTGVME
ncbi:MAG: phosphotransferase [Deltaproteobacteria bacterium]|nr:phosphotransferase [Deltaproteobacteria bacterium]